MLGNFQKNQLPNSRNGWKKIVQKAPWEKNRAAAFYEAGSVSDCKKFLRKQLHTKKIYTQPKGVYNISYPRKLPNPHSLKKTMVRPLLVCLHGGMLGVMLYFELALWKTLGSHFDIPKLGWNSKIKKIKNIKNT